MMRWWLLAPGIVHHVLGLKATSDLEDTGSLWPSNLLGSWYPDVKEEDVPIRSACTPEEREEFLKVFGIDDWHDIPDRTDYLAFEGAAYYKGEGHFEFNFTKNLVVQASNRPALQSVRIHPRTEALLLLPYARNAKDNAFLLSEEMCKIMLDLHRASVAVTFRRVTGITEAAEAIREYPRDSLGWVSLGGHGDGKTLAWVPKGGVSNFSIAAVEEAGVQSGFMEGQSFVAGGRRSKVLLDLLAARFQPNALLYMMSCHAGVCPTMTLFNRGLNRMTAILLGATTALVGVTMVTPPGALAAAGVSSAGLAVGAGVLGGAAEVASSESLAEWTSKYLGTKGRSDVRVYAPGDSFNAVVVEPDAATGIPVPIRAGNDYKQEPKVVKMHVFEGGENKTRPVERFGALDHLSYWLSPMG